MIHHHKSILSQSAVFRVQAHFGVTPDLTTMGKVIGGGLPVGAYGMYGNVPRKSARTQGTHVLCKASRRVHDGQYTRVHGNLERLSARAMRARTFLGVRW